MSSQSQQTNPEGLESLKKKISKLQKLSDDIKTKIDTITDILKRSKEGYPAIVNILRNYQNYVNYLKQILQKKLEKDETIIKIQKEVFEKLNSIMVVLSNKPNIALLGSSNVLIEKKQEHANIKTERNALSESNKRYLVDINPELLKTKYKLENNEIVEDDNGTDLISLINENKTNLINCNITTLNSELNDAFTNYQSELQKINSTQGGANVPTIQATDGELFKALSSDDEVLNISEIVNNLNNNTKITKINAHTTKLKNIKKLYEKGLIENIKEFKEICEALKNLIITTTNICTEYSTKIKNIKDQNKQTKTNQNAEIKKLNDEISKITSEIQNIKKGQQNITLLGLNTSLIENINIIFDENKKALKDIKDNIEKTQNKLDTPAQAPVLGLGNSPQARGPATGNSSQARGNTSQGNPPQGTGNPGQARGNTSQQGQRTGQDSSQAQGNSGQGRGQVNTGKLLTQPATKFLLTFTNIKEEDIVIDDKDDGQIREEINKKLNELETLDKSNSKYQEKIKEIEQLFDIGKYTLSDKLETQFKEVKPPGPALSTHEKYLLLKFISLLTVSGKFEEGLEELNKNVNLKKLINKILDANNNKKRQELLIELYEQRPGRNLNQGGKSKKSKKSKKSSKSKTSKKVKSNKKAPRTQVKSYNNPKYKNQDGGFVRGGVLFPESFYRSDIVM